MGKLSDLIVTNWANRRLKRQYFTIFYFAKPLSQRYPPLLKILNHSERNIPKQYLFIH